MSHVHFLVFEKQLSPETKESPRKHRYQTVLEPHKYNPAL